MGGLVGLLSGEWKVGIHELLAIFSCLQHVDQYFHELGV